MVEIEIQLAWKIEERLRRKGSRERPRKNELRGREKENVVCVRSTLTEAIWSPRVSTPVSRTTTRALFVNLWYDHPVIGIRPRANDLADRKTNSAILERSQ